MVDASDDQTRGSDESLSPPGTEVAVRCRSAKRMQLSLLDLLVAPIVVGWFFAVGQPEGTGGVVILLGSFAAGVATLLVTLVCRSRPIFRLLRRYAMITVIVTTAFALSLGPACWLMTSPAFAAIRSPPLLTRFLSLYRPVGILYARAPDPIHPLGFAYLRWWAGDAEIRDYGWGVGLTVDGNLCVAGT